MEFVANEKKKESMRSVPFLSLSRYRGDKKLTIQDDQSVAGLQKPQTTGLP
jgi:hypothetical protein